MVREISSLLAGTCKNAKSVPLQELRQTDQCKCNNPRHSAWGCIFALASSDHASGSADEQPDAEADEHRRQRMPSNEVCHLAAEVTELIRGGVVCVVGPALRLFPGVLHGVTSIASPVLSLVANLIHNFTRTVHESVRSVASAIHKSMTLVLRVLGLIRGRVSRVLGLIRGRVDRVLHPVFDVSHD